MELWNYQYQHFSKKKASHRRKVFLARFLKSFLGRLFLIGGLMIRSCQGLGVVHKWNAFSSRSNHLKIKPCDRTIKLWKFFPYIQVLIVKKSHVCVMFNFLYIDSHLGYWYIIWKVNIRNTGMNLRNTLFVLICLCG